MFGFGLQEVLWCIFVGLFAYFVYFIKKFIDKL